MTLHLDLIQRVWTERSGTFSAYRRATYSTHSSPAGFHTLWQKSSALGVLWEIFFFCDRSGKWSTIFLWLLFSNWLSDSMQCEYFPIIPLVLLRDEWAGSAGSLAQWEKLKSHLIYVHWWLITLIYSAGDQFDSTHTHTHIYSIDLHEFPGSASTCFQEGEQTCQKKKKTLKIDDYLIDDILIDRSINVVCGRVS